MKSLEETLKNIDKNVEIANRRLKDIYHIFEHYIKDNRYALNPAGYQKILEGYQKHNNTKS